MFVRFVCCEPHPTAAGELGMFSVRDRIDFGSCPGRVQRAHDEAFFWFSANGGGGLKLPRFSGKARTAEVRKALFWFKADAHFFGYPRGSVVERARQLADVITAAGMEIRELRCDAPGQIIWEDLNQVLAVPTAEVPRAFP